MAINPSIHGPAGAPAAAFFAENLGVPYEKPNQVFDLETPASHIIKWSNTSYKWNTTRSTVRAWKGEVPGTPTKAFVKRITAAITCKVSFRWIVMRAALRFEGCAKSKEEAFEMAERAARALPCWLLRVQELREKYGIVAPTPEEERAFKAIELLVGVRPRYTPIRGSRAWSLRDEDIPKDRMADWERHGHTVCCMLRDLIK